MGGPTGPQKRVAKKTQFCENSEKFRGPPGPVGIPYNPFKGGAKIKNIDKFAKKESTLGYPG